jgi:hypothetical protein
VQGEIYLSGETDSLSQPGGTIFLQYSSTRRKNEMRLKMRDGPRSQRRPDVEPPLVGYGNSLANLD